MHAHARNCFRRAENVNKLVANHANATNMYKVNDLKRLKKAELLEVAAASKLQLVSAKSTKRQLIETLVNHGVCQRSPCSTRVVLCTYVCHCEICLSFCTGKCTAEK